MLQVGDYKDIRPGSAADQAPALYGVEATPPQLPDYTISLGFDYGVDVVVHSYRHRYGLVTGDPAVAHIETRLTAQPDIPVPSITIDGDRDGVAVRTDHHANKFSGPHRHSIFENAGHNLPQENPPLWAQAVLDARALATG